MQGLTRLAGRGWHGGGASADLPAALRPRSRAGSRKFVKKSLDTPFGGSGDFFIHSLRK